MGTATRGTSLTSFVFDDFATIAPNAGLSFCHSGGSVTWSVSDSERVTQLKAWAANTFSARHQLSTFRSKHLFLHELPSVGADGVIDVLARCGPLPPRLSVAAAGQVSSGLVCTLFASDSPSGESSYPSVTVSSPLLQLRRELPDPVLRGLVTPDGLHCFIAPSVLLRLLPY